MCEYLEEHPALENVASNHYEKPFAREDPFLLYARLIPVLQNKKIKNMAMYVHIYF